MSRCALFALLLLMGVPCLFAGWNAFAAPLQVRPQQSGENQEAGQGYALTPERAEKAIALARARRGLYFADTFYEAIVLLLLLRWQFGPALRALAERATSNRLVQAVIVVPVFLSTLALLTLPGSVASHWLARSYGQSIQSWISWFWDWAKGQALSFAVGTLLIWLLYTAMRASPRRWWLYAWLSLLPIIVVAVFLVPLVFEPMFFHFTPLTASRPELAAQLERVVLHAGQDIPESRMYVMNASSKLNTLNAYVTGLGASRRVVVWDTTLVRMTAPEILFVFGHEMGHYVLGHIRDGIVFAAGLLFACLFAGFHVSRWVVGRWGRVWGIRGLDDWASLPILFLLFSFFSFLTTPIDNAYSRHLEHQADQYGLEVVHGVIPDVPQVAAQSFQILGDVDLEEPSPSWPVKIWFYDHPPISERIVFARTYDPWTNGESPKFVK